MAEVASAYVSLLPSARGFGSKLDGEISGDIKSSGKKAGSTFGKVFAAGAGLLAAAGLKGLLSDSIGEAREAQKVGALTESIIKSTGGAAKISAAQVGDLSAAISAKAGIDDEAIQSGANLLLTFKEVRNEVGKGNDIFNRATRAAADLSSAGFGDLSGQAKMLGKALNDPVKGMTALSRSGVTFTKAQQDQVKALVASGDALTAQKIILNEVESQVGGAAAATATAGDKAAVAMGNLKEQAGTALLPVVDKLSRTFTKDLAPAISGFISGMQNGTGAGGQFVGFLGDAKAELLSTAGFIKRNSDVIVPLAAGVLGAALAIKTIATVTAAWTAAQAALNVVMAANPITIVVVAVAALAAGLVIAYKKSETFRGIVDGAFSKVKSGASALADTVKVGFAAINVAIDAVGKAGTFLWNKALQPAFQFIVKGVAGLMDIWADMLGVLGKVPGFGWAKDASKAMADAAATAREVADGITKIPNKKDVKVVVTYQYKGLRSSTRGGSPNDPGSYLPRLSDSNGPKQAFNEILKGYGKAGQALMERIEAGIKSAKPKAVKAAQDAFDALKGKLEQKRDGLRSTLDGLKDEFDGIRDSVKEAFAGGLFNFEQAEGQSAASAFVENLMGKKSQLAGLLESFKTLSGWGIDPGFLTQLFASGQGALITELAGMGQTSAVSTASLFGEVTSLGNQLGTAVAGNDPVSKEIQKTNELLVDVIDALSYLGSDIGKELNEAASKAQRGKKGGKKK